MAGFLDDLGGDADAVGVDERAAAGGILPAGFYKVKLDGALNVESTKNTPGYELTFTVIAGPFEGAQITDKIWRSDKQAARDRIKLFAHRLGLLKKSDDGKTYLPVEGKESFTDCLDTECVIEVVHEPDQNNPSKFWPRFAWAGVYTLNDPVAVAALKNGGKRPDPPAAGGKAAPAKGLTPGGTAAGSKPTPAPAAKPAQKRAASVDL